MSNKIKVITAPDSDSDEEIVETPLQAKKTKKSKKVELVDDSIDVAIPKKRGVAAQKKVKEDSDSDNDDETKPKKQIGDAKAKSKTTSAKITKKNLEKDDSEADNEEEAKTKPEIAEPKTKNAVAKQTKEGPKKKVSLDDSDEKIVKKKPLVKKTPKLVQTPSQMAIEVKSRIVDFLTDRAEFVPTIEIAKHIYGDKATRKMVNKELYGLLKTGTVEKQAEENGTNPHWKIA